MNLEQSIQAFLDKALDEVKSSIIETEKVSDSETIIHKKRRNWLRIKKNRRKKNI